MYRICKFSVKLLLEVFSFFLRSKSAFQKRPDHNTIPNDLRQTFLLYFFYPADAALHPAFWKELTPCPAQAAVPFVANPSDNEMITASEIIKSPPKHSCLNGLSIVPSGIRTPVLHFRRVTRFLCANGTFGSHIIAKGHRNCKSPSNPASPHLCSWASAPQKAQDSSMRLTAGASPSDKKSKAQLRIPSLGRLAEPGFKMSKPPCRSS